MEKYAFFLRIDLEYVRQVVQMSHDVSLLDLQLESVVLEFVKVQKLIHQTEHTIDVSLYYIEESLVFLGHRSRICHLAHRSHNHCKRSAELVRHIGKKGHIHLIDSLFLIFLLLSLELCGLLTHNLFSYLQDKIDDNASYDHIYNERPPGEPKRRSYPY